ncbi:MAG TPA: metalloregulator ArsR/SmtB family transcription factor [Acidimicrobiales bacterium]|nr:metalloregulator ArsR/SmtB family transcription factor [Acidimicrobiales bacterium]
MSSSAAIEIEWALASGEREDYQRDHTTIGAIYERNGDLQARVRAIWGPGATVSCGGFLELMVVAHHGGLLFSADADTLLDRLDELCVTVPSTPDDLPLLSETPEDRAAILLRLARLKKSSDLRRQYVTLVRDVWNAIRPDWELSGRGAVEAAMASRREMVAKGAHWHELGRDGYEFGDLLDRLVAALGPGGEVVVVPAFYTHCGLLVDLPGVVVLGVRTDTTGAEARARTAVLARRLKAISDPTRLAMLDALRGGPRTATDLAAAFSLAQPTVSNHVKVLRDAGLVTDVRDGARRNLVVQQEVVGELLMSLQGVLSGDAAHAHGGPDGR